jgi:hypothetical protein
LNAAATKIFDAASNVQSALGSAATSFRGSIEEYIPKNCSLGIKQFCIGYNLTLECMDLPFNTSALLRDALKSLPGPVEDAIREQLDEFSPLEKSLNRFPIFYISSSLISGVILISTTTFVLTLLTYDRPACIASILERIGIGPRTLIQLALGLFCCIPFIFLNVILFTLFSKTKDLPSWISVDKGEVFGLCLGALGCATFITVVLASSPAISILH